MAFKFKNGDYVEAVITGFRGYIISRCDHLTGCNRYLIQPPVDKDGKHQDSWWYDETTLKLDTSKPRLSLDQATHIDQPPG